MKTYRVGEGHGPSGKILDPDTKWFNDYESAKGHSIKTGKKLYVSINHQKYKEII